MKINHIGLVVQDLKKSQLFYVKNFHYTVKVCDLFVSNQDVHITMLQNPLGGPDLELIKPGSKKSPSFNALKKHVVLNHTCYEAEDYDLALMSFRSKIVRPSMPAPIELFGGRHTFFAFLDGTLFEFVGFPNEKS